MVNPNRCLEQPVLNVASELKRLTGNLVCRSMHASRYVTVRSTARRTRLKDEPRGVSLSHNDSNQSGEHAAIRRIQSSTPSYNSHTQMGQGADLHVAQLMPLPLTVSCSSKSRMVLPFWCRLTRVVPDIIQEGRMCMCVHACADDNQ